jgi:hypothetical protein
MVVLVGSLSGCTVEDIDVDHAAMVAGTYALGSYDNQLGAYGLLVEDKVVITRINNNHIKIHVDFYNSTDDIIADEVQITPNGNRYNLAQTYRFSVLAGSID